MTDKLSLCPHCGQNMIWRRRALNSSMARTLLRLLWWEKQHPGVFAHAPTLRGDNHEVSQLSWWGFVEEKPETMRDDGNPHAGYWRITPKGKEWAMNRSTAPSHAFTFNTRYQPAELDQSVLIRIDQVRNFNYDELIRGI